MTEGDARRAPSAVRRLCGYLLAVALLGAGAVYLGAHADRLRLLRNVEAVELATLTVLVFLFFCATGLTFWLVVRLLGVRLGILEVLALTFLTNAVNYLGPVRPGAAAKALYLKGEKGLAYSSFASVLAANSFIVLLLSGVTGLILLLRLYESHDPTPVILWAGCLITIAFGVLPFLVPLPTVRRGGRVRLILSNAVQAFETIRSHRTGLMLAAGSVLLQYALSAAVVYTVFHVLGVEVAARDALLIGVFTSMANLFTLTPNNLGVQEVVTAWLSTVTGIDFGTGILAAGLVRAIHIVLTFGLAAPLTAAMLSRSRLTWADVVPRRPWADSGDNTGPRTREAKPGGKTRGES